MTLLQDFRYSARTLLKRPAFVITITIILALGIGANSAIFSVVNAVLIRPLPYEASDRIVTIWETNQSQGSAKVNRFSRQIRRLEEPDQRLRPARSASLLVLHRDWFRRS